MNCMNTISITTRGSGHQYTARGGGKAASSTSCERLAVERLVEKLGGSLASLTCHKPCGIEEGKGWQPGRWTVEVRKP